MDILEIPFHRHLNIERSGDEEDVFYCMEEHPEVLNHLGTIHACAQLALAEATSGGYLIQQFPELNGKVIPVIRKTEVKYSTPAFGKLSSRASFLSGSREQYMVDYMDKGRCIIPVKVEVFNTENKKTLSAVFSWFITSI